MREMTTQNYKFFQHKQCEFFPCHKTSDPDNFNCLFCYCPLYALGDACGGSFKFNAKGVKDCTGCSLPHRGDVGTELVKKRFPAIVEMAKKRQS